ncbi:MAG TPA: alpha/beta fold hydrolase [Kofleriaceae bacterium]|jgi:pimeloyl-ACP methyl ester carboxylesterase
MRTFLALSAVLLLACGGDDDNDGMGTTGGPRIRFEIPDSGLPAPGQVPFPTDLYKDTDGTLVDTLTDWTLFGIDMAQPSAMFKEYGALNGFGVQSAILFSVAGVTGTEKIDPASLTPDRFVLVDTAGGSPLPVTAGYDAVTKTITVLPTDPLLAGHTYALGVLHGPKLLDADTTLGADTQFGTIRDGGTVTGAGDTFADAVAKLAAAGVAKPDLIAATELTTNHEQDKALETAQRLFSGEYVATPPALNLTPTAPITSTKFGRTEHAGWTATLDAWLGTAKKLPSSGPGGDTDLPGFSAPPEATTTGVPHDAIAAVITGSFVSPQFPRAFGDTAAFDDGTTAYDASGNAVAASMTTDIPVLIVLPAAQPPQDGFPVVMFQHGLGGSRWDALAIANEFARAGYATVAVDAPLHGMRDSTLADQHSNGPGTYTGADGFADTDNALVLLQVIGNAKNALRARDILWQWPLDLVSLRRFVDGADLSVAAAEYSNTAPTLNKNKVAFMGWSMGGLTGTAFAALAPGEKVDPVVLTSPASNIGLLFGGSPVYANQATLLAGALNLRGALFDAGKYSPALQLYEGLVGSADTGQFAPIAAMQHNLLVLAAEQDESVPHESMDQLMRAMGAKQLMPNVRQAAGVPQVASPLTNAGGKVTGFFEVSPGNHSHTFDRYAQLFYDPPYPRDGDTPFVNLPAPITIRQTVVGEQRAIVAFIASVFAGTPKIDVTNSAFTGLAPVNDFDDDGACDSDETAAGTDPLNPSSVPSTKNCMRTLGF